MLKGILVILILASAGPLLGAPAAGFSADRAIRQLGDAQFKKRTAAQEQLLEWGRANMDEGIERFYGVYRTHDDPEVRVRARELLKSLVVVKVAGKGEGYIGIMMREDDIPDPNGGARKAVRITAVMEDTPAEKAKLIVGDLVMGIDAVDLSEEGCINTFGTYVRSKKPGDKVTLHMQRNNQALDIVVELMRRPRVPQPNMQFWGEELRIPSVRELEEEDFRAWLQERREKERKRTE